MKFAQLDDEYIFILKLDCEDVKNLEKLLKSMDENPNDICQGLGNILGLLMNVQSK